MKTLVHALRDDAEFHLELTLLAGAQGLDRQIQHTRVQKPGLALAGLVQTIRPGCVQILGKTEITYLQSLDCVGQTRAAELLFGAEIACAVVTTGLTVPPCFMDVSDRLGVALLATTLSSGSFIARIHDFLDEQLSLQITLHGVLVDVFGVGVLLQGHSGIGKSECALDLILRGHCLVADDVILVKQFRQRLEGIGSPLTRHHMEVRGLGIINVKDLFGAASVRERKPLELVVELHDWSRDMECDRMGIDDMQVVILGVEVPRISIPVRPGRNIASIVEVAARNHLLKMHGHHSAREFKETLERRLAAAAVQYGRHGDAEDDG